MPIISRCSLCGQTKPPGKPCPFCQRKRWNSQQREQEISQFYNSRGWGTLRKVTQQAQGNIDLLLWHENSQIIIADVVHHIIPIRADWSLRLNADNLICLSDQSHKQIHDLLKCGGRLADEAIRRCREARGAWYASLR